MLLPTVLDVYRRAAGSARGCRRRRCCRHPGCRRSPTAACFLKIESVNLTNSFKIRGAMNAAMRLSEGIDASTPTMVTASAGNHGRALALAAEELGLSCVVFTPADAPEAKQNAIRRHGAMLHSRLRRLRRRRATGQGICRGRRRRLHFAVQPSRCDRRRRHRSAWRSSRSCRLFDVVVIPLGGGGLASGMGLAIKAAAPTATIVGVEVEASTPFTLSLEAGRITEITPRAVARRWPGRQPRTRMR